MGEPNPLTGCLVAGNVRCEECGQKPMSNERYGPGRDMWDGDRGICPACKSKLSNRPKVEEEYIPAAMEPIKADDDEEELLAMLEKDTRPDPQETTEIEVVQDWEMSDRNDEKQILAELRGEVVQDFVYKFRGQGNEMVKGLTWSGVKYIGSNKMKLSVEDVQVIDLPDRICAIARCKDLDTEIVRFGAAEQAKMQKRRNGPDIPDNFALAKAVNKAQRNAMRNHIPEEMVLKIMEEWEKERMARKTGKRK